MGGGSSRPARQERAFICLSWDSSLMSRMMMLASATASAEEQQHRHQQHSSLVGGLLNTIFAVAPPPVVDARRLIDLIESSRNNDNGVERAVRTRLVLFSADVLSASIHQISQNTRLWRIFRRRHYHPIVGLSEMQAQAIAHNLRGFQHRARRRGAGVIVMVTGDGSLERSNTLASSLRSMLSWGHRLEVWSWAGMVPPLYKQLQGEYGETRVQVRYLDDYRQVIRYGGSGGGRPFGIAGQHGGDAAGANASSGAGAAAGGGGGGGGGPAPMPVAVAVPVAVGVAHSPPLPPLGKDDGTGGGGGGGGGAAGQGQEHHNDEASNASSAGASDLGDSSSPGPGQQHHHRQSTDDTYDDDMPDYLLDPISMEPLVDPVVAPSGYTYERSVILNEIAARGVDPMTQQPLAESDLRPNRALKEMIEAHRQQRHGGER